MYVCAQNHRNVVTADLNQFKRISVYVFFPDIILL